LFLDVIISGNDLMVCQWITQCLQQHTAINLQLC